MVSFHRALSMQDVGYKGGENIPMRPLAVPNGDPDRNYYHE